MDVNGRLARTLKASDLGRNFGVAAYRAAVNIGHKSDANPVLVNTLAKAGTHLVMALLDAFPQYRFSGRHFTFSVIDMELPDRELRLALLQKEVSKLRRGKYMTGHIAYHPEIAEYLDKTLLKKIYVVRDPRALVVSNAFYMKSYARHPLHETAIRRFSTDEEFIRASILGFEQDNGTRHLRPMSERIEAFAPWIEDDPRAFVIRFEDLIGASGGGSRETQVKLTEDLNEYLGLGADSKQIEAAADAAFDPRSATFRSGEVDGWRKHMTPELLDLVENECAPASARIGYHF